MKSIFTPLLLIFFSIAANAQFAIEAVAEETQMSSTVLKFNQVYGMSFVTDDGYLFQFQNMNYEHKVEFEDITIKRENIQPFKELCFKIYDTKNKTGFIVTDDLGKKLKLRFDAYHGVEGVQIFTKNGWSLPFDRAMLKQLFVIQSS